MFIKTQFYKEFGTFSIEWDPDMDDGRLNVYDSRGKKFYTSNPITKEDWVSYVNVFDNYIKTVRDLIEYFHLGVYYVLNRKYESIIGYARLNHRLNDNDPDNEELVLSEDNVNVFGDYVVFLTGELAFE